MVSNVLKDLDVAQDWKNNLIIEEKYLLELGMFINSERKNSTVYPKKENVFKCFKLTPLKEVKVVILGQDPYHSKINGVEIATGLAFESGLKSYIPPSLRNIYQELYTDLEVDVKEVNIESWAKQGVLMLNTALTVIEGKPNSHSSVWVPFTEAVFNTLSQQTGIVYVLWGNASKRYKKFINPNQNYVLEASHPSPLSANQGGWFGNKHFSKINEIMKKSYGEEIKWL